MCVCVDGKKDFVDLIQNQPGETAPFIHKYDLPYYPARPSEKLVFVSYWALKPSKLDVIFARVRHGGPPSNKFVNLGSERRKSTIQANTLSRYAKVWRFVDIAISIGIGREWKSMVPAATVKERSSEWNWDEDTLPIEYKSRSGKWSKISWLSVASVLS